MSLAAGREPAWMVNSFAVPGGGVRFVRGRPMDSDEMIGAFAVQSRPVS